MCTTKKHIVEILVYAALLTLIVSRTLLDLVTEYAEDDAVFPPERWAATPVACPAHPPRTQPASRLLATTLLERLAEDAQKIHKQRPILHERLATTTQQAAEC